MANNFNRRVFIAIPQYRPMLMEEVLTIAAKIGLPIFSDYHLQIHPAVEVSLKSIKDVDEVVIVKWVGSLIDQARSGLFALWRKAWMTGNRYDYLMFIDSDISFPSHAIAQLIDHNKPLIGGACANRNEKNGVPDVFPLKGEKVRPDGLIKIWQLGGAFILLRSDLLLAMMDFYPELKCVQSNEATAKEPVIETFAFWMSAFYEEKERKFYMSEDWSFCERAMKAGFEILLDTGLADLIHWEGAKPLMIDWSKALTDPKKDKVTA